MVIPVFFVIGLVSLVAGDCPAFPPFGEWSEKCVFPPLKELRKDVMDHCHIAYDADKLAALPELPKPAVLANVEIKKCGYCSFKVRCASQEPKQDGCFAHAAEKKECGNDECENCGAVCDIPKLEDGSCDWAKYKFGMDQCVNADVTAPDWKRDGQKKLIDMLSYSRCIEKDGTCKCCCHPYKPNADGTACEKEEQPDCPNWNGWNDWSSDCLWFPLADMMSKFKEHCQINSGPSLPPMRLPMPVDFVIPSNCGYCSYRVKCRKRDDAEGCFALEVDKKVCGPADGPGYGDACSVPKLEGGCDYQKHVLGQVMDKINDFVHKAQQAGQTIPFWKEQGFKKLISNLPQGKCIEHNDQCKCCCHPFEPVANGDAIECKPVGFCASLN